MVTLKKIKLNQLSKTDLDKRSMNALKGGHDCYSCTCNCVGGMDAYNATPINTSINTATAYVPKSVG